MTLKFCQLLIISVLFNCNSLVLEFRVPKILPSVLSEHKSEGVHLDLNVLIEQNLCDLEKPAKHMEAMIL